MQNHSFITCAALLLLPLTIAAQDTILNRNVTVERDFQPIISSAGIVNVKPVIVQQDIEPAEVTRSRSHRRSTSTNSAAHSLLGSNQNRCTATSAEDWGTPILLSISDTEQRTRRVR